MIIAHFTIHDFTVNSRLFHFSIHDFTERIYDCNSWIHDFMVNLQFTILTIQLAIFNFRYSIIHVLSLCYVLEILYFSIKVGIN